MLVNNGSASLTELPAGDISDVTCGNDLTNAPFRPLRRFEAISMITLFLHHGRPFKRAGYREQFQHARRAL